MQASHATLNRLEGTTITPTGRHLVSAAGAAAAASTETIDVDADPSPVASTAGAVVDGGNLEEDEEPPAWTPAVERQGRLSGSLCRSYVGADGMERGRIGGGAGQHPVTSDVRMVPEYMSVAARIREYYNELPEVSKSVPVVDPDCALRKTRFSTKALRRALAFSLTAGGCGMSENDHLAFAHVLFEIEAAATQARPLGLFSTTFPTTNSFLTESKHEQRRVLAMKHWMRVPIVLGDRTFQFFYRDVLDAGLEAMKSATTVSFGPDERQVLDGDDERHANDGAGMPLGTPTPGTRPVGDAAGVRRRAVSSSGADEPQGASDRAGDHSGAGRGPAVGDSGHDGAVCAPNCDQRTSDSDDGSGEEIMPVPRSRRTIYHGRSGSGRGPAASGVTTSAFATGVGASGPSGAPDRRQGESEQQQHASTTPRPSWPRRGTLDSDLYCSEAKDVKRLHGREARVMAIQLHADEALVSWSGAHHIFPVRVKYVNVLDDGGVWVTIGYIEHVPKAEKRSAAARLEVSDIRNDLLQRCLAVALQKLIAASATGVTAEVAGYGSVRLVPRIVGLVVDQVEERSLLGLMGNQCNYYCSLCMISRAAGGGQGRSPNEPRTVVQVLEAQLAAAVARREDPRPSLRKVIGDAHSALAFVPVLGAMHGLSTGGCNLYNIVSFDVLHVWKLGVLRMLAQRLPAFLESVCGGSKKQARLGSVQASMDAINQRGFHLGRLCKASPCTPGYVNLLPTQRPCLNDQVGVSFQPPI